MLLQRFVRGAGRGALKCLVPLLLLFMSRGVECLDQVDLVALIPGVADGSDDYFPLAPALSSAYRLAVEHINENGALLGSSILSVEVVESLPASAAAASLCKAIGNADKSTVAVLNALGTPSASLMGSLSNGFLGLPILNIGGMAARSDSRDAAGGGGFLVGVLPDIFPQMKALVRLILDMKLARDAADGRSEETEQVWLVHTSDSYGSTAASAFGLAARNFSVAMPVIDEFDDDGNTADGQRATIEITRTTVLAASSSATFTTEMATLAEEQASIIILLVDGYDPAVVRNIFTQARTAGLTEGVQWYLPDAAAMDHIFQANDTYRDAELAYDMRGTLGVRACPPLTGTGSDEGDALTAEWQQLDPSEYPGAGANSLTADGRMDPLLAFAYDSVFVAAAAVREAMEEVLVLSVTNFSAISLDRCPFPINGTWENGTVVRDSIFSSVSTMVGATGPLNMSVGVSDDGRDVGTVTFCAVNLRPHTTAGARFEVIRTLQGAALNEYDGGGFEIVSPYQEEQTFPANSATYPLDRPMLLGRHLDVVMRRNAPPFVFVAGDGTSNDDFTGITPTFLKTLSERLGFTYTLRAPAAGTSTTETITMVRNGSADMTGSWITITAERSEYVTFTYPYYDLDIAFAYLPTASESVDLWKAFAPFEPTLWLTLLFALVGTVFLLWLFEGAKNDQFAQGNWGKRRRTVSRGLSRSIYVTASLMMAQLTHKPETLEGYLLTLGWLFTSFVLAASYTAELASFLTATKQETTGLSIDGLLGGEISHSDVALLQGGNTQMLYERDFMRCADDGCSGIQPQPCYSTSECFEMVRNGSALTALSDSATAEYLLQTDFCDLSVLPETLYPQHYGLVLPLGSAFVGEFQLETLALREDGTLQAQSDLFLDSTSECVSTEEDEDTDTSNMTVGDVSGVFVVLMVFVSLSVCSWCWRRSPLAKNVRARRLRARGPTPAETIEESFSKLSRRQQKSFALEATVRLLQESKGGLGASSRSVATTGGMTPEDRRDNGRRQAQRDEIEKGRPVVTLGDSMGTSTRWNKFKSGTMASWFGSSSKAVRNVGPGPRKMDSRDRQRPGRGESGRGFDIDVGPMFSLGGAGGGGNSNGGGGRGGGGADAWSSNGSARPWTSSSPPPGSQARHGMFGMFGRTGSPPVENSPHAQEDPAVASARSATAVQGAASKWLARRRTAPVMSPVGERVASETTKAAAAVVVPNRDTRVVVSDRVTDRVIAVTGVIAVENVGADEKRELVAGATADNRCAPVSPSSSAISATTPREPQMHDSKDIDNGTGMGNAPLQAVATNSSASAAVTPTPTPAPISVPVDVDVAEITLSSVSSSSSSSVGENRARPAAE